MPKFAVLLGFAVFASAGLPGLNGFVGEFLTMLGAYQSPILGTWTYVAFAALGVILAAAYLLRMYNGVIFGPNLNPKNHALPDLTKLELWQLVPVTVFLVWIGIYPSTFLQLSETNMRLVSSKIEAAHHQMSQEHRVSSTSQPLLSPTSLSFLLPQEIKNMHKQQQRELPANGNGAAQQQMSDEEWMQE